MHAGLIWQSHLWQESGILIWIKNFYLFSNVLKPSERSLDSRQAFEASIFNVTFKLFWCQLWNICFHKPNWKNALVVDKFDYFAVSHLHVWPNSSLTYKFWYLFGFLLKIALWNWQLTEDQLSFVSRLNLTKPHSLTGHKSMIRGAAY